MTLMLNLRHKLALCATLVCVGLIVLLGAGTRAAIGIGILGVAFSWAFGSNYRLVHWLFVVFGFLLLVPGILDGLSWPRYKPEVLKDQAAILESDRDVMKNDMSLIAEETNAQARLKDQEEYTKHSATLFKDQEALWRLRSEGIYRHVVTNDWGTIVGGLLLLTSGLGLMVGVKPVRKKQTATYS